MPATRRIPLPLRRTRLGPGATSTVAAADDEAGVGVRELPAGLVLLAVAVGIGITVLADWRAGCYVVGVALLVAAGLRTSLPERSAGLLAVRGRGLDAALLLLLGTGVLLLANSVPTPP